MAVISEHLYELPFDQFQRYKGVEEVVRQLRKGKKQRILDVGGFPGLIADFLPEDEAYVVDIIPGRRPNYVRGDGTELPFKDGAFDVVIAVDTLEHVPIENRGKFVSELIRCGSKYVILMGPFFSENIQMAEKIIFEFSLKTLGRDFANSHPLREHLEHGLPDMSQFANEIDGQGCVFEVFPSGYLYHWIILNFVKHFLFTIPDSDDLHKMIDKYYNLYFYEEDKREPSYRHMLVITKNRESAWLKELKQKLLINQPAEVKDLAYKIQLFGLLFSLFDLGAKRELHEVKRRNLDLEGSIRNLESQLEILKGQSEACLQEKKGLEERTGKQEKEIEELKDTVNRSEKSLAETEVQKKKSVVSKLFGLFKDSIAR
jgi:SAM-dependent methyltransferase